jgi:hypothetical protein
MGDLDFKLVVHHGEMVKQVMAGHEEFAGRDAILVHSVTERLGHGAYVLYSDACIQAMSIDPVSQGLVEHRETVDVIGEVRAWFADLQAAWHRQNELTRLEVMPDDAYLTTTRKKVRDGQTFESPGC